MNTGNSTPTPHDGSTTAAPAASLRPSGLMGQHIGEVLPIAATLRGKHLLISGATGFLGKVLVSMILYRLPDVGRLYLLIRDRKDEPGTLRLKRELIDSPAFGPLRERYSDGLDEFVHSKVEVISGDVTRVNLGLDILDARALSEKIDLIINSAGITNFNPSLDTALEINTLGPRNVAEFAALSEHGRLLHISTCYVAGCRDGKIAEELLPEGWIPDNTLELERFDVEKEIEDCQRHIEELQERAEYQQQLVLFRTKAREQLEKDNRNHKDPEVFLEEIKRQKRKWLSDRLREEGIERAKTWGWTNIYTYSKSLGEQVLTRYASQIQFSILRPSIVESANEYPLVGWNEGINTCAPMTFLMGKGARFYPAGDRTRLDVVPVDRVCRTMITTAAAMLRGEADTIYQISSSERNPIATSRVIELSTLWHRRRFRGKTSGSKWYNLFMQNMETVPVSKERYEWTGAPIVRKSAGGLAKLLGTVEGRPGSPLQRALTKLTAGAKSVEKAAGTVESIIDLFIPFVYDRDYIFRADNIRKLDDRMTPGERQIFGFQIEDLDWREYWLEVQMPGLDKWVFHKLEDKLKEDRRRIHTYDDLVELFDSAARNYPDRAAVQLVGEQTVERYTYADMHALAERAAARLIALGAGPGRHVMLMSENKPQWGMAYFGVLKTGAACVPVDPEMASAEVWNLVESCEPVALITSVKIRARLDEEAAEGLHIGRDGLHHLDLKMLLSADTTAGLPADVVSPEEAEAADSRSNVFPRVSTASIPLLTLSSSTALVPARHQTSQVASLIYTSGTTGRPKGVMLTHKNFTSLLRALNQSFKVSEEDGFLSVLPLHHTFEFASGFLLPISKGATITYIDELNAEALERAFDATPITIMIGVPALWQVFHRRILSQIKSRGPAAKAMFDSLTGLNRFTRQLGINLGPMIFAPAFKRFGGKIRYLISGGASLPPSVFKTFDGLGFTLLEGYGLTETSPVLTVNRPGQMKSGSVGKALPGVTVEIVDPDGDGVGEIRAKGPNVMAGYHNNPEQTAHVLRDGWFYTGDLGRFDRRKRLYIVGRKKDVIIAASGKNVYPDELEDYFSKHPNIEELAIVGLPDGSGGERVAALVRPDYDSEPEMSRDSMKAAIRGYFEVENSRLAFHQRIKVLRFTDDTLPRTATRKVKRNLVQTQLLEMEEVRPGHEVIRDDTSAWLFGILGDIGTTKAEFISHDDQMISDLGFDSLMLTELASRIQERTGVELDMEALGSSARVRDVLEASGGEVDPKEATTAVSETPNYVVEEGRFAPTLPDEQARDLWSRISWKGTNGLEFPELVAKGGSRLLDWAQKAAYAKGFNVKVYGKANIPYNRRVIVVANHSSHLDMGVIKYALWDFAPQLSALAARDYFFKEGARNTYFSHFTNLIPVERSGTLEESLSKASEALEQGRQLLLFPEGTRSVTGELQPFRRGLGYLAVRHHADILPVHVSGTFRSLPKGKSIPRARRLEVRIGEPLTAEWLDQHVRGMPKGDAYTKVGEFARDALLATKVGKRYLTPTGEIAAEDDENAALEGLFGYLEKRFVPKIVDHEVSYYFSIGEAKWTLLLGPEACSFRPGKTFNGRAGCVLKCQLDMFRKIVKDHYTPSFDEFMDGTVKTNDPTLLMKFQTAFAL
ncbi:MAG: AMP-dependent synthetase [Deltaproteobacteria bacterium CG17_big_fil_post_rev_8_21_14_2_50_63_7]|nr:MAG: AMP-dependent synthetase [Deltaproteobacteria bacterium CG17_big_fil_post_rev_8_21_14_2_50_63_7]